MRIKTTKLQRTDTRGERVHVTGGGFTRIVPWDYRLSAEQMHERAARVLAQYAMESYSAPEVTKTGDWARGCIFETVGC